MAKKIIIKIVILFLVITASFVSVQKAFSLPGNLQNDFNDAALEQTERYYMQNPSALNQGNKQQRSGLEKNRLNSESYGVSGLGSVQTKHSANVYSPMAGVTDTMYSKEHANQLGKFLGSPFVLYMTTMQLTEPAVAAGVQNSAMQGYASVGNRYAAEEHFVQSLEADPESRQILLPAYRECVATYIRKRDPTNINKVEEDSATWIQAQSYCMADRTSSIEVVVPNAKQFDKFAHNGGKAGKGFDMLMDSHSAFWQQGSGHQVFKDANTLFLTDYLFNQSNFEDLQLNAKDLKKSFEDLLGNYEFTVDPPTPSKLSSASRELRFIRTLPTKTRSEFLDEAEADNYQKIIDLVEMRCDYNRQVVYQAGKAMVDKKAFCVKNMGPVMDKFMELSFVGFEFDCNLLEELFTSFTFEDPSTTSKKNQAGGGSGRNNNAEIDCSSIGSKSYTEIKDKAQFAKSAHANVAYLAGEISLGQIYMLVYNIQQVVDNLTTANKQFASKFAYQLIENFIGSGNIYEKYSKVVANLEVFKQRLVEDRNRKRNKNNL